MRLRFLSLTAAFFASLAMTSCSDAHDDQHSAGEVAQTSEFSGKYFKAKILEWTTGPEVSGDSVDEMKNACRVEVWFADGTTPSSISVDEVFPYMKVHGHGAPDEQIKVEVDGSLVTVSNIAFTMSGPWELHLKVSASGQSEELEIPLQVP